jgi:hypothetical protein
VRVEPVGAVVDRAAEGGVVVGVPGVGGGGRRLVLPGVRVRDRGVQRRRAGAQ